MQSIDIRFSDVKIINETIGPLLGIGSFGFVYENIHDKDTAIKIIPIYKKEYVNKTPQEQVIDIVNEHAIQARLSQLSFKIHQYDHTSSTMILTDKNFIVPKIGELYRFRLEDSLLTTFNDGLIQKKMAPRLFENEVYAYITQKVGDFVDDFIKIGKYSRVHILVSIYQLIEIYQQLVSLHGLNFGHHDLHAKNLSYIVQDGKFSVKIIDFGFSCLKTRHTDISSGKNHDDEYPSATQEVHAIIDVLHLISSCYILTRSPFLASLICDPPCLYSCINPNRRDAFFFDFYSFDKGFPFRSIKICKMHEKITLQSLKELISKELSGPKHSVKWTSHIDMDESWMQFIEPVQKKSTTQRQSDSVIIQVPPQIGEESGGKESSSSSKESSSKKGIISWLLGY